MVTLNKETPEPINSIPIKFNIEQNKLSSYACIASNTKGRVIQEKTSSTRSIFRRDCDRVIHSEAFRLLEYKTQVFVSHQGDYYRTRLTHSLEVAQIARSISRNLFLNEDLAEVLSLAHDLGHSPFGHAGEDALRNSTKNYKNVFNHNAQTIKVLTCLEKKYAAFEGLNLCWEVIEGLLKHNGPIINEHNSKTEAAIHPAVVSIDKRMNLNLEKFSCAEAQVASFADDIAYNNHDIDDGLRASLFSIEDIEKLPIVGNVFREVKNEFVNISKECLIHEANSRMINRMIVDLVRQTTKNIEEYNIETEDDIRNLGKPLVSFSSGMQQNLNTIGEFLNKNMYRHYKICRIVSKAKRIIKDLFDIFFNEPECLPTEWQNKITNNDDESKVEVIVDYISGMTDLFAIEEHHRLFDIDFKG